MCLTSGLLSSRPRAERAEVESTCPYLSHQQESEPDSALRRTVYCFYAEISAASASVTAMEGENLNC